MIPSSLKKGTPVRCIDDYCAGLLRRDEVYTLHSVDRTYAFVADSSGVIIGGWNRDRFEVATTDGSDYQSADDVDLLCEPLTTTLGDAL